MKQCSLFECFSYPETVSSIRTVLWCLGGISTGLTSFTFCTKSITLKGEEPRCTWHWRLGDISTTISSRTRYTSWNLQDHKKILFPDKRFCKMILDFTIFSFNLVSFDWREVEDTPQTFDIANEDLSRFDSIVGILASAGEPLFIKE